MGRRNYVGQEIVGNLLYIADIWSMDYRLRVFLVLRVAFQSPSWVVARTACETTDNSSSR